MTIVKYVEVTWDLLSINPPYTHSAPGSKYSMIVPKSLSYAYCIFLENIAYSVFNGDYAWRLKGDLLP